MTIQAPRPSARPRTIDPLATASPLWIRQDGHIRCTDHLDEHSRDQALKSGRYVQLFSPDGPWFKLNRSDLAEFLLQGSAARCEACPELTL